MNAIDSIGPRKRLILRCVDTGETHPLADWAREIAARRGAKYASVYSHLLYVALKSPTKQAYGLTWCAA